MFCLALVYLQCTRSILSGPQKCTSDYKNVIDWLRKAAGHNSKKAQYTLGRLYGDAGGFYHAYALVYGLEHDPAEAIRWHRMAADNNLAHSQFALAFILRQGMAGAPDYARAAHWYSQAAEQNHEIAQFGLGELYEAGDGVPQDEAEAYFWYYLSAFRLRRHDAGDFSQYADKTVQLYIEPERKMEMLADLKLTSSEIKTATARAEAWLKMHRKQ